jgi:subtilisin family serine protease
MGRQLTVRYVGDPALGSVRLLVGLPEDVPLPAQRRWLSDSLLRRLGPVDAIGDPWRSDRLFGPVPPEPLVRWWTVAGAAPSSPGYDLSRTAYDLASRLAREPGCVVEPDLPSSAFGRDVVTGASPAQDAGGRSGDLPCSSDVMWAIDAVRAREVWDLPPPDGGDSFGGGVRIGHIDTGWTDHPELERPALNLALDRDVIDRDDVARDPLERMILNPLDSAGHGTATGSVIAGRVRGEISGVAPKSRLVCVRAIRSVVQVLDGDVARAVNVARDRGCHIVTMALGGRGFLGLRDAIRTAVAEGLIVMAAAGNRVRFVVAPASYPECIAVAATDCESRPWDGSSGGAAVDISAPGASVWNAGVAVDVTPPAFVVDRGNGTSFAVSVLAGVAALWLGFHGPDRIRRRYGTANVQRAFVALLRSHGHRVPPGWVANGWSDDYGIGVVDAVRLLQAGLPELPAAAPAADVPEPVSPVVARLQPAFGSMAADEVRRRTGGLLGVAPEAVDELPPTLVSELVYRLGEDEQLRAALLAERDDHRAPHDATARSLLHRTASLALRGTVAP